MRTGSSHPDPSTLALLAGGDLPLLSRLQTRWHLRFCANCAREFEPFRAAREELRLDSGAGWPQQPDGQPPECDPAWSRLEAEMRANIRLGLTAGSLASGYSEDEAAASVPASNEIWRWAAVCGALAFVLVAGLALRAPVRLRVPIASATSYAVRTAEPAGGGANIQLLVPVADVSRTETGFDGSTRSRVIDGETGQVTLQQVYVE